MVLCVDCFEAKKETLEITEELPKKKAKKCTSCGKLKRAIYIVDEKAETVVEATSNDFDSLVESFAKNGTGIGTEISEWLAREADAIKSIGRDYWTPQGIFWFAYQNDELITTFNGNTYESVDSILAV